MCYTFTNLHVSPNYNNQGKSQTNSSKTAGSPSATSADGTTSSNIGSSSSSGSLSSSNLANGHAVPLADKSTVSPGSRRRTYVTERETRTHPDVRGRMAVSKDQPVTTLEGRTYTRNSYIADQTVGPVLLKSDSRGTSCSEQSAVIPGFYADVRIVRQDKPVLSANAVDGSASSQASEPNVSPDARGGTLRIEQPMILGTHADGTRATIRSEPSANVLSEDDLHGIGQSDQSTSNVRVSDDLRAMRQTEQVVSIRVTEDLCEMRPPIEQSNVRMMDDLRGIRQTEQPMNIRMSGDLRAMRQQSEQSISAPRLPDDLRNPRAEQSMNAQHTDLRGVLRGGQHNASITLTDGRAAPRPEQSTTVIPLTDGRTIPVAEHISSATIPDLRPIPRIPQAAVSLPTQSTVVPVAGQSSAQPGASVLIAEDAAHSEEPLPSGWEMKYDVYGRR